MLFLILSYSGYGYEERNLLEKQADVTRLKEILIPNQKWVSYPKYTDREGWDALTKEHKQMAGKLKNVMATYQEAEDLINIGAYKTGSNKQIDYAISKIDQVNDFICQSKEDKYDFDEIVDALKQMFQETA